MRSSYQIEQAEVCNWLYKADHHYLAARLLYLHGLLFAAEENAGFAIELILKTACNKRGVDYRLGHKLTKLWKAAKPPIKLDEGYLDYLSKLEKALYNRHPDSDSWDSGHAADDRFDALDLLYLKLRKWLKDTLLQDEECIPTELVQAMDGRNFFSNVVSRHGAWDLTTILRRSNARNDLI